MAKNPFKPSNSVVNHPNRNSFDLSFTNHLTMGMGQLIPCACFEALPGDTFEIDTALGLRFMPLAFPIQTKCRAHVHLFYQRTKNVWKDFSDFIYGNDRVMVNKIVHPYINFSDGKNSDLLRTCSLGDYLGLPTVSYSLSNGDGSVFSIEPYYPGGPSTGNVWNYPYLDGNDWTYGSIPSLANTANVIGTNKFNPLRFDSTVGMYPDRNKFGILYWKIDYDPKLQFITPSSFKGYVDLPVSQFDFDLSNTYFTLWKATGSASNAIECLSVGVCSCEPIEMVYDGETVSGTRISFDATVPDGTSPSSFGYYFGISSRWTKTNALSSGNHNIVISPIYSDVVDAVQTPKGSAIADSSDYKISALPFRVYESIYNAFYRDNRNNPFYKIVNGKRSPVYNEYCTTNESGADSTNYGIYNRNWEMDQFTSATQSPQLGAAPLVGISSTGKATFAYDGKEYTFTTETADDADTIVKINVDENVPDAVARSIVNVATSGISINDFRNVNAYQRWLETNIRRGLKYKDQTLARWGVEPKDSTLDMPEFIGGFSVDIDVNQVTNVAASDGYQLGDYAGQATAFGSSKHKIRHYCDQHGFIMAIISVVPTPVYTQLLPKMFLRESALDYYSPEFGQIGMQAVPYRELCPLELGKDGSPAPTDVYGYQRPWYEYIYRNDEAHGLFRSDFNQFLLSRTFLEPPVIGPSFLTVKESSLNDVFSVKSQNSILGMIRFNIEAKRPIPSVSIPSL